MTDTAVADRTGASSLYVSAVNERIEHLRADLRSFIYLRTHPDWQREGHGLGGGNVVGALAAFSLLGLLAKVVRAVRSPTAFALSPQPCETCGRGPRIHEVNETDAFGAFVQWLRTEGVELGVKGKDATDVWREYRDWLVHRFDTKHFVATMTFKNEDLDRRSSTPLDVVLRERQSSKGMKIIGRRDGRWIFTIDMLYIELDAIERAVTGLLTTKMSDPTVEILDNLLLGNLPASTAGSAKAVDDE